MALLDFLKNRKNAEKSRKFGRKAGSVKVDKKQGEDPARHNAAALGGEKPAQIFATQKIKAGKDFFYEAVNKPHISEKASDLSAKNQYIFEVSPNYNKNEIKKAVQGIYGVDVLSVNVIKIPSKKRRLGKTEGFRKKYKKAIVKIAEGQKIEIL